VWFVEDSLLCYVLYIVVVVVGKWEYVYSCEEGVFFFGVDVWVKYWLLVCCIDGVYGDWYLVCLCLLLEVFED